MPTSGTVGAARVAARNGIRALAVSQGSGDPPDYPASARRAVAWVKQHRAAILAGRGKAAPDLVGVDNLNVPTCTSGAVRGLVRVPVSAGEAEHARLHVDRALHPVDDVAGFAPATPRSPRCSRARSARASSRAPDPAPTVQDRQLDEVSGVVASRVHPPNLWVHNDSGGEPAVTLIAPDGRVAWARTRSTARPNVDWEDIAIGPGPQPDTSYLYLADIGDNASARDPIVVYRVPEPANAPDGTGGTLSGVETISLRYPDQPVDAESLIVDPLSGDLFVIDKEYTSGIGKVFRAPKSQLADGADITLEQVASFTVPADDPGSAGLPPGHDHHRCRRRLPTAPWCSSARTAACSRTCARRARRSKPRSASIRAPRPRPPNGRAKRSVSPPTARATSRSAKARARPSTTSSRLTRNRRQQTSYSPR